MLALLLVALLGAETCPRLGERCQTQRVLRGWRQLPLVSFARGEKGLTAPCACAAVTGARGEVFTATRASSGMCTKSNEWTNIANGDLVLCGSSLPRIMSGADGGFPLGILSEDARTNVVIRSAELDNVAWTEQDNVVGSVVITANAAVAPDGTTTAEQLDFPAVDCAGQLAEVYSTTFSSITGMSSFFVKGFDGGSGSLHFTQYKTVQANSLAGDCAFVGDSWTRCYGVPTTTQQFLAIGPNRLLPVNSTNAPAQSVYVWGAMVEAAPSDVIRPSSYVATTSASVARSVDTPHFTTNTAMTGTKVSIGSQSATVMREGSKVTGGSWGAAEITSFSAGSGLGSTATAGSWSAININLSAGGNRLATLATTPTINALQVAVPHVWLQSTEVSLTDSRIIAGIGTTRSTEAATGHFSDAGVQAVDIGWEANNVAICGVVSNFCADSRPGRCR